MTGACYYCSAQKHSECSGGNCTCCGELVKSEQQRVDELEAAIRRSLGTKRLGQ